MNMPTKNYQEKTSKRKSAYFVNNILRYDKIAKFLLIRVTCTVETSMRFTNKIKNWRLYLQHWKSYNSSSFLGHLNLKIQLHWG